MAYNITPIRLLSHQPHDGNVLIDNELANTPLNAHILLVDDYPSNTAVASILLEHFGCTYIVATNGQEALELVKAHKFDLVLMDVNMPIMDGFAATRAIRSWEREHAKLSNVIIGLTAHAMATHYAECLTSGMDSCLAKPFESNDLWNKIKQYKALQRAA